MRNTEPQTPGQWWDAYVGSQTPQQFMNISRQDQPDISIEQAVTDYVREIPFMFGKWHEIEDEETGETEMVEWSQEELDGIAHALAYYLELGQGEEWN